MRRMVSPLKSIHKIKLLADLAVLSGGQLISKLVGFLAFAYLARVLGPRDYGSVEYAVGLSGFCAMVIGFGLGPIGVRELAHSDDKLVSLTSNIPVARAVIVAISIPAMALAAWFSDQGEQAQRLVGIFALSLLASPWLLDWLLQARNMMGGAAIAQLLRMVIFALGVAIFVKGGEDLLWVGWSELAAVTLTAVYYLWLQQTYITPIRLRFTWSEVGDLFRQGLGVGGGQTIGAVNVYAPLMLVANLADVEATAWFGASHRVVASLSTFSLLYHFNLYPVLAHKLAGPSEDLDRVVRASMKVVAWISIGGALALTLLRSVLVEAVYGDAFVGAATTFGILVWYLPATLLSGHARWLMIAANGQRYVFFAQLIGALTTVIVGVPLVTTFQAEGAAIAMVAGSIAVWISAQLFALLRVRRADGTATTVLPALWALIVGIGASQLSLTPWLVATAAIVAYWGAAPLLDRRLLADLRHLAAAKSYIVGGPVERQEDAA